MRAIDVTGMTPPAKRDPGAEPILGMLPIERLVIDPEYQRPVGKDGRRAIERIAASFQWTKFSTVIVAPVSGDRYAIIDGQHRTSAAKLCGMTHVPCQIVPLDRAGQASAFAAINGSVTKITVWNIYKAALAAGEGWAVRAKRAAEAAGCKLMTTNKTASTKEPGELYGVSTIRDLIDRHGEALVTLALAAYRRSIYGDVAVAWNNLYVLAWVTAVARCSAAAKLSADRLAQFHDVFDILEADDVIAARLREQKREGKPTPAHWDALCDAIVAALDDYAGMPAEVS